MTMNYLPLNRQKMHSNKVVFSDSDLINIFNMNPFITESMSMAQIKSINARTIKIDNAT